MVITTGSQKAVPGYTKEETLSCVSCVVDVSSGELVGEEGCRDSEIHGVGECLPINLIPTRITKDSVRHRCIYPSECD